MGLAKATLNLAKNAAKHPIKTSIAGFTLAQPFMDIHSAKKEGYSTGAAIGKGLLTYTTFELFPGLGFGMLGYDLAKTGVQLASQMSDNTIKTANQIGRHNFGGYFTDSQPAYTMRQRGVQAIQNNGINARSVLGNEARNYTRGHYE